MSKEHIIYSVIYLDGATMAEDQATSVNHKIRCIYLHGPKSNQKQGHKNYYLNHQKETENKMLCLGIKNSTKKTRHHQWSLLFLIERSESDQCVCIFTKA
jgi:hypothetical protein